MCGWCASFSSWKPENQYLGWHDDFTHYDNDCDDSNAWFHPIFPAVVGNTSHPMAGDRAQFRHSIITPTRPGDHHALSYIMTNAACSRWHSCLSETNNYRDVNSYNEFNNAAHGPCKFVIFSPKRPTCASDSDVVCETHMHPSEFASPGGISVF